jgi:hypothetical protein
MVSKEREVKKEMIVNKAEEENNKTEMDNEICRCKSMNE